MLKMERITRHSRGTVFIGGQKLKKTKEKQPSASNYIAWRWNGNENWQILQLEGIRCHQRDSCWGRGYYQISSKIPFENQITSLYHPLVPALSMMDWKGKVFLWKLWKGIVNWMSVVEIEKVSVEKPDLTWYLPVSKICPQPTLSPSIKRIWNQTQLSVRPPFMSIIIDTGQKFPTGIVNQNSSQMKGLMENFYLRNSQIDDNWYVFWFCTVTER